MFRHQARKLTLAFVGAAAATALAASSAAFAATPAPDRATTVQIDDEPNSPPDPPPVADIQVQGTGSVESGFKVTYSFKVKNAGPDKMKVFLDGKWCARIDAQGSRRCQDNGVADYYVTLYPGQSQSVSFQCDPSKVPEGIVCKSGSLHAMPAGTDPNPYNNKATVNS